MPLRAGLARWRCQRAQAFKCARGRPPRPLPLPRSALTGRAPTRGHAQIDENVAREIVNHRMLRHANVVMFKEARRAARVRAAQRLLTRSRGR